jgi:hypothetical protein
VSRLGRFPGIVPSHTHSPAHGAQHSVQHWGCMCSVAGCRFSHNHGTDFAVPELPVRRKEGGG